MIELQDKINNCRYVWHDLRYITSTNLIYSPVSDFIKLERWTLAVHEKNKSHYIMFKTLGEASAAFDLINDAIENQKNRWIP